MDRDVVVVGGGSTGCSVLFQLAKSGVKAPLLVDSASQLAAGQTSRSTALIRTHYSTELLTRMAILSYRFFKDFPTAVRGRSAGYVETGLIVGADGPSVKALEENSAMHKALGIDSRLMTPSEFAESKVEPMIDANAFSQFAYEPNAGYAEPSATATAFASAAIELGGEVMTGTKVKGVSRSQGRYSLETTKGPIACRKIVLATGVWSKPLFAKMGVGLPIKVSRHPVAVFGRPSGYLGVRPVIFDFPRSAYYKPEGKDLLFVGTLASEVDVSGPESDPDAYDRSIGFEEASSLASATSGAIPTMAEGTFRRGYAGLYDNTPDQHPVIDELSAFGYPDVFCVVGLSGHGFKLAPEFGRVVATMMTAGTFRDYDVSVLRLKRFEEGRLLGGRYRVSTIS